MKNNDYLKVVAEQQCKRVELVGYNKEKNISDIPNDYIELEYLESTGSQYIRTSLISNRTRTIDMDFMFTQLTSEISYVVSSGTGSNRFQFGSSLTNSFFGIGDLYIDNLQPLEANRKYNLKIHDYSLYIDDVKVAELNTAQFVSSITNINLFDSEVTNSKVRIYKADFNSGLNVFIPVKRKSDNLVGMYNIVNNRFYERYGTGEFKAGDPRQTGINASSPFTFEGDNLVDLSAINVVRPSTSAGTSEVIRIPLIQLEPNSVYYLKPFGKFNEAEIHFLSSSGLVVYSCGSSGFATGDYVNPYARCELAISGLQVNTEYTFNQDTLKLMLVKSNTPPTKYVPYIKPLVVGENLWDEQWELGSLDNSTGSPVANNSLIRSKNFISVKPNTTYYFLCEKIAGDRYASIPTLFYGANKGYLGNPVAVNNATFTTPNNCYFIKFRTGSQYGDTYLNDIMISEGITAKPYSPYIHPIDLYSNNGERDFVSMLIKGYTEKSGDSLLSANTPLKYTGENLANPNSWTKGGFNAQTGLWSSSYDTFGSGNSLIGVNGGTQIKAFNSDNTNFYIFEFDANRNFIKYTNANIQVNKTINIQANTRFIGYNFSNGYNNRDVQLMITSNTSLSIYEPYHETFYNPTEGFSLNKVLSEEETFETITGILTKKTDVRVNDRITGWNYNQENANAIQIVSDTIPNYKGASDTGSANLISTKLTNVATNLIPDNLWVYGFRRIITIAKSHLVGYSDDLSREEKAQLVADYYNSLNVSFVYLLNTPQTYQKKPKTLPQWVKHCFDNSGRELDMTLTPITLNEPVADTYQNANGKITRKTNKIELSIQNSVAQEYTGYSYLLKFAQPLAKPNTPILCDLENTNIVQDNNYLIVEYHNPSFTTQEQYYNYFLYEKHELIYERATYDTETIRSLLLDHRYTKCTDANGEELEMKKA